MSTLQAANWGSDDCVRLLLARSANPDAVDGLWRTPLMLAAMHAHRAHVVMQTLIDAGIILQTRFDPSFFGFSSGRSSDVTRVLGP